MIILTNTAIAVTINSCCILRFEFQKLLLITRLLFELYFTMSLCVLSIDLATNVGVTSPHHNHAHCTQRVMCSIRSPHSEGYTLNILTGLRG